MQKTCQISLPWNKANFFVVGRKLPKQTLFCYANGKPLKVKNISYVQGEILS